MKKLFCGLVASILMLECTTVALAESPPKIASSDKASTIVIDCSQVDLSKPYKVEKQYINDFGETITIGAVYIPAEETGEIVPFGAEEWSHSYQASEGTWTSYYKGVLIGEMNYDFDVSFTGKHWRISNARNLMVSAMVSEILDKSLVINRDESYGTLPAEVMGSCTLKFINTPIGPVRTLQPWIKTTISDSGILTVCGN